MAPFGFGGGGGGGGGNIETITSEDGHVQITNPDGPIVDLGINLADGDGPGLMTSAQFTKLAGIQILPQGRSTLLAPSDRINITGLDGDTYGDVEVYGSLQFSTGAVNSLLFQPNPSGANTFDWCMQQAQGAVGGFALSGSGAGLFLNQVNTATAGTQLHFRVRLKTQTNDGLRYYEASNFSNEVGGRSNVLVTGNWLNTADNLIEIRVLGSIANGLLAGSFLGWRALGFTA